MSAKDIRGIDCQRAVDEHRHARHFVARHHLVQVIDQLLGAAHGEGRDDHFAAALSVRCTTWRSS